MSAPMNRLRLVLNNFSNEEIRDCIQALDTIQNSRLFSVFLSGVTLDNETSDRLIEGASEASAVLEEVVEKREAREALDYLNYYAIPLLNQLELEDNTRKSLEAFEKCWPNLLDITLSRGRNDPILREAKEAFAKGVGISIDETTDLDKELDSFIKEKETTKKIILAALESVREKIRNFDYYYDQKQVDNDGFDIQ